MRKINIGGRVLPADDGMTLSEILIKNGFSLPHPCGGMGSCKKCTVSVNGKNVLSCQYKIHSDIDVIIPHEGEIISPSGTEETGKAPKKPELALDIGTTTLALALIDTENGRITKTVTCTNPQRAFGDDVISRIDFCSKNGVALLKNTLIEKINEMVNSLGIAEIPRLYASGNTTMLHLFLGVDCSGMGVSPYTPVFLESRTLKAHGIERVKEVITLPCISAFTGADIVSGLNVTSFPQNGKYSLLVDLGTNAEVVLFSENKILCTSAAAGPCFEGAGITHGMSAVEGAIYSYSKGNIKTVGDIHPRGICATGLVDIIASCLDDMTIDKTGFMECEEFSVTESVFLTQKDVREFQLAKSAVYSAIAVLMKKADVSFDEIEKMYISGGFSSALNIENGVKAGLIPSPLKEKCTPLSNSSLLGTVKYAIKKNDLSQFTEKACFIDLSEDEDFSRLFLDNMMFH